MSRRPVPQLPWIDPDADDFLEQFVALPRHKRAAEKAPLSIFSPDHLERIALEALWDEKPNRHILLGTGRRPLAMIDSRSWWEWHWIRGHNPGETRDKIPAATRAAVIERDDYVCQLCGGDVEPVDLHLDHIRPWSKGGSNTLSNLQVTHALCNIRKGARYVVGSV